MKDWLFFNEEEHGDLRYARSKAELVRTRNSNIALLLVILQVCTNILVALRVFHLI